MPQTLIDVLRLAAEVKDRGYTFLNDALEPTEYTFDALEREAQRRARYFLSLGLKKGDRLAMVVPDGEDFVLSFFGAIRAGLVPVPMYPPLALGKLDAYVETARRILITADAKVLLTNKKIAPIVWSLVSKVPSLEQVDTVEKVREKAAALSGEGLDVSVGPDDTCFLQFTSGSTSDPKGVVVTHANLVANSKAIMVDGLASNPEIDRGVSWLPLYHDMGLIGFVIAPLMTTVPVVFIPTLTFVKRPNVWMDTVSKYRGSITFGPNFAFGLAAKRASKKRVEALDLNCLRVVGCGAEPINAATMRSFVETFSPAGFDPNGIMPAYGMAEATLAIAFDRLDEPFETLVIDRDAYEERHEAIPTETEDENACIELVACGKTFPEHEIGIMSPEGELLAEGKVGEIVFSGPSVSAGYFRNEEATRRALVGKWLHTGDLGFIHAGQIYISGRMKDLIILNGRNYYPQSIEWEAESVDGTRRGNIVAFSVRGEATEDLVVVAETKLADDERREALQKEIKDRLNQTLGVRASSVELLPPGALPKTSSGKLQRAKTKRMFEEGTLGKEGVRTLGSRAAKVAVAKHLTSSAVARLGHELTRPARSAWKWVSSARRSEER